MIRRLLGRAPALLLRSSSVIGGNGPLRRLLRHGRFRGIGRTSRGTTSGRLWPVRWWYCGAALCLVWSDAGVGIVFVDAPEEAGRDERDHVDVVDACCVVAYHVHVMALVDEGRSDRRPRTEVLRGAAVSCVVDAQRARLDDHQAWSGMAVPAERPARRDDVLDDVNVGGSLGRDLHLPEVLGGARVYIGLGFGVDPALESA